MVIWWAKNGLGAHEQTLSLHKLDKGQKAYFMADVFYSTAIWLVKISALLFFYRIFSQARHLKKLVWLLSSTYTAWWIVMIIYPWTECHPAIKHWNTRVKGVCKDTSDWFLAATFLNWFFDMVVLILPMPFIWKLHMKISRKIATTLVFVLGYR